MSINTDGLSPLDTRKLTQLVKHYRDQEVTFIDTLHLVAPRGFTEPALDRIHDWWWEVFGQYDEAQLYMDWAFHIHETTDAPASLYTAIQRMIKPARYWL